MRVQPSAQTIVGPVNVTEFGEQSTRSNEETWKRQGRGIVRLAAPLGALSQGTVVVAEGKPDMEPTSTDNYNN